MPRTERGVGYVLTGVVWCRPKGKDVFELMRPGDGEPEPRKLSRRQFTGDPVCFLFKLLPLISLITRL